MSQERNPKDGSQNGNAERIGLKTELTIVKICDTGDVTTFIHEMTHVIRKYMKLEGPVDSK